MPTLVSGGDFRRDSSRTRSSCHHSRINIDHLSSYNFDIDTQSMTIRRAYGSTQISIFSEAYNVNI